MEPLTLSSCDVTSFNIPFLKPFNIGAVSLRERSGFYLTIKTSTGGLIKSEASPLEGVSHETVRRTRHDLIESCSYLKGFKVPQHKEELLDALRHDAHILNCCPSVRFAVESALLLLAAGNLRLSLVGYLGGQPREVQSAVLLQGNHAEVIADVKKYLQQGAKVFKLKVGDRNIALDVKKVTDLRTFLPEDSYLRLDANRGWTLKEACVFADLCGNQKIDFIEEPVKEPSDLDAFFQQTRMRVGLDETLSVVKSGIRAPARCASPLAAHEGVCAYVLKPMMLGLLPCLDWMEEAALLKRKAIISSAFESPVGFKVLAQLACLSGQIAGMGTERWLKDIKPIVAENGIIKKESLS